MALRIIERFTGLLRLANEQLTKAVTATGEEQTANQTSDAMSGTPVVGSASVALTNPLPKSFDTYRTIRNHPTVAFTRILSMAPIMASEWTIEVDEGVPDEVKAFLERNLLAIREPVLNDVLSGCIDYGWAPFEKVFHVEQEGGYIGLKKLKPLLHDITEIMIEDASGVYMGLVQTNAMTGNQTVVEVPYSLLINFRVEGSNYYGESLLEGVRQVYDWWSECNAGAARYDKRMAGSHWIVKYPNGQTAESSGGPMVDNSAIADKILKALVSSGSIMIPKMGTKDRLADLGDTDREWDITLQSDASPRQPAFIERLNYLDKCMARRLLMPERAFMEGQYGTKAEAESHAETALSVRDLEHRHVVRQLNWHLVDQLLALNWGDNYRGKARIVAAPLSDAKLAMFREMYAAFLTNPTAAVEALNYVDLQLLGRSLGLPERPDADSGMIDDPSGADPSDAGIPPVVEDDPEPSLESDPNEQA